MSNPENENNSSEAKGKLTLPFLILTKDLIIRPLLNEDRRIVRAAIKDGLAHIKMWLPWTNDLPKANEFTAIANKYFSPAEEDYHYAVYQNDMFMGICSYIEYDEQEKTAHLAYWCRANEANDDYFIDAVNAVITYAFKELSLKGFSISCIMGNFLSEQVAKVLNFKLQGIHIVKNQQIKLFRITQNIELPELEVNWVKDDFEKKAGIDSFPAANEDIYY
ncbi:MAG: GNAT family N-acetyltransferase [Rickettsiales bacterium]